MYIRVYKTVKVTVFDDLLAPINVFVGMFGHLWTIARKPIVASAAVVTASITSAAVIDYNREVIVDPKFVPRPTTHIRESMENLHDLASEKMLTFGVLKRKRNDTVAVQQCRKSQSRHNERPKGK